MVFFCDGCGVLAPNQGSNLHRPTVEGEVPTIGLPGRFLVVLNRAKCICQSQTLSLCPALPGKPEVFSLSLWVCFCFIDKFIGIIFFRFCTEVISHDICLSLSDFTWSNNLQVHPCCCKWHYFVLYYGCGSVVFHILTKFTKLTPY